MLKTIFNIAKNSLKNLPFKKFEHKIKKEINNIIPSAKVVSEYQEWLDLPLNNEIPPHLFPLWSYPHLFKLGQSLNLPLHKVLNQGCKLKVNSILPTNSPLNSKIEIYDVKDLPSKYRINQRITTSSKYHTQAVIAEVYAVILKDKSSSLFSKAPSTKIINTDNLDHLETISITKEDAQSYALISGDINPIHLSQKIAKLMGLKGSIMHGFGLFAILYEKLKKYNFEFSEIDVRFLNPVYLGEEVSIFIDQTDKTKRNIKVLSGDKTQLHLSGYISL